MSEEARPIPWWEAEPARLERDKQEVEAAFPDLSLSLDEQGTWSGRLPMWPLDRPEPDGLSDLLGGQGMQVVVFYGAAYPVVFPYIVPVDPEPLPSEWTLARWHVLGNGALCLYQTHADWDPNTSLVDLLRKAAAWRVEYALVKSGLRQEMTVAGILNNDSLDHLIAEAVKRLPNPAATPGERSG